MKKVTSIVLNNFKNDSRVLKENISLQRAGYDVQVVALHEELLNEFEKVQNIPVHRVKLKSRGWSKQKLVQLIKYFEFKLISSSKIKCIFLLFYFQIFLINFFVVFLKTFLTF